MTPKRMIELRKWLGWPQEYMARVMAVSFVSVNRWERGHAVPISLVLEVYKALDLIEQRGGSSRHISGESPGRFLCSVFGLAYGRQK